MSVDFAMKSAQEQFGCRVGEAQTGGSELEAFAVRACPALLDQTVHFAPPFVAQILASNPPELFERPACVHAQAERGGFAGSRQRAQLFSGFDCAPALLQLLAIELRVRPIFRADTTHITSRAGTQAVITAASPIDDVVFAGMGGNAGGLGCQRTSAQLVAGEVGDLILLKPRGLRAPNQFLVHGT